MSGELHAFGFQRIQRLDEIKFCSMNCFITQCTVRERGVMVEKPTPTKFNGKPLKHTNGTLPQSPLLVRQWWDVESNASAGIMC